MNKHHDHTASHHGQSSEAKPAAAHSCCAHKHDQPQPGAGGTVLKDPVCGMTVTSQSAHSLQHEGKPVYFCSAGCKTKFATDPAKYSAAAKPAVAAAPQPEIAGAIYTCPMHPEVRQVGPGACPICGMALEPELVTADTGPNPELADMGRRFWIGLVLSLLVYIGRASRPHIAELGRIPGSEHFRNVKRYEHLETWPDLLLLRVDEHLSFANTAWLEETLMNRVAASPRLKHLILVASGINGIDTSGLETLSRLAISFREAGITLHLAEVKGPVMDRLKRSHLLAEMAPGRVFLSTHEAVATLAEAGEVASS